MAGILCSSPVVSAAESQHPITVSARVDRKTIPAGEMLNFWVMITGNIQETPQVQMNNFEGFKVVSTGQSQNIQVGAGQTKITLMLNYLLAPVTVGTHTLGSVKVGYQGQTYQT